MERARRRRGPVRRRLLAAATTGVVAVGLAVSLSSGAVAQPSKAHHTKTPTVAARSAAKVPASDVREVSPKRRYSTSGLGLQSARTNTAPRAAGATPAVGTVRTLLALDDYNGFYYRKAYTLRGVGDHIEVWVANDTAFPAGDCRAQVANSTTVTNAQVAALVTQFDTNMYPKESAAFSVAPDRDGSGNVVPGVDPTGSGNKTMTLVDNVRDDNYYEGVKAAPTYIAGFFSSQINELLDRNVMTIDAFDWAHRTGANPPDNPTGDPCTSRPAKPRVYESTFAHEYQHLLEYYQDPSEVSWVNEGLSMFAELLVGYSDPRRSVFGPNPDIYAACYQGYGNVLTTYNPNPRDCGGPENSLTLWGDQPGQSAILADYGEAYVFMTFLYDRYGLGFMSTLHRDGRDQGLVGLQHALDAYADGTDVYDVLHDFQVSTLVDKYVGTRTGTVKGASKSRVTSPSLSSSVNLGNPTAYAAPGAPANGADYVGLRARTGLYLKGEDLRSLSFSGARQIIPEALKWTSVAEAPEHGGQAAIWSGNTSNLDANAVAAVTVPSSGATLTYDEYHLAEATYDYAYTVISTDGGQTYTALANANTVAGPLGPALNGDAAGWATQTFDLSAYAGKSVLIGFRYVSDGGTNDGGWYVDNAKVGSTVLTDGGDLSKFRSFTQVRPYAVANWNVRIVGLDTAKHRALVKTYEARSFRLSTADIVKFAKYPRVVAVVSYDEPSEQIQPQALYTLTVNGVVQPGGGQSAAAVRARADRF